MQEMLASMESRFKSMFGNSGGMFANSNGMFGNGMPGVQSSSSVFSSSSQGGSGIDSVDSFFGPNFFQQPCQQNFTDTELLIKCNVSAYDPNEVKVDVKASLLTISAKRVENSSGDENGHNSTTQFQQSLYLTDYNMEKMTSDVKDGLLTVTVPRIPHHEETDKVTKSTPSGEIV